jgi:hypothetical protein
MTRTTDGAMAAAAFVAIEGRLVFSSVCRTAWSMSFCVSSGGAGRVFAYARTSATANSAPAATRIGCSKRR